VTELWDGLDVSINTVEYHELGRGLTLKIELTEDEHGQQLVTPIVVFIRLNPRGGTKWMPRGTAARNLNAPSVNNQDMT
jgi:hypothetical protein